MTLSGFLLLLLIAGICGSVAQAIVGYSHGGCLVSVVLGLVGAVLGTWLAKKVGIGEILAVSVGGQTFPIVWSVIGAALCVAILSFLRPRNRD
ncbi:MAG TPA: GlsB/YeaQ/YmgE family stress response membrane protein [Planctomycetaceae bacterium]|nr:GlsB/YeaQ/YmgE family stress response membrane protein [Planctomycetaceae bacterium]HQZ68769.1 GlsB/YeaQ/YmgE family stress response membrane protein [Planctomycetaceae bacterium]